MHAQIITYKLNGISNAEYAARMVEPDAPILAEVAGLHSKVWLANPETNTFGGFYLWHSRADMEAFMASELVATVVSRPFLSDIEVQDFEVPEAPSRITRGLAAD
ncbi:MAG: YdhR family protein [Aquidulcibacter sp.]|uniref:YdhR family protein n=1 Tax=Aquidulcibacter sp. TaxID=2052990 RepID=UPI0022C6DCFF|nr:YdhR family protein [Aquidulcibacter sp.]